MKNLLVTGLYGKTGKYFFEYLLNDSNYNINAIIRNNYKFNEKVNNIQCDLNNFEEVNNALKNIDIVFHIAGIKMSKNIIEASINNNVKWVILVHTTGIYSKYKSASKEYLQIEEEINNLIKNKDIKITILRPTMIYGSLDDSNMSVFIKMVDKLRLFPIVNGGRYKLQPVYQKDLGKAYYDVLKNYETTKNNNYDLSGDEEIYLIDILKIISKLLNKRTKFIYFPYVIAYILSWLLYCFTFKKIDYREKVQRLVEPRAYSNLKARNDFGYTTTNIIDGLKEEVDLYLKRSIKS